MCLHEHVHVHRRDVDPWDCLAVLLLSLLPLAGFSGLTRVRAALLLTDTDTDTGLTRSAARSRVRVHTVQVLRCVESRLRTHCA